MVQNFTYLKFSLPLVILICYYSVIFNKRLSRKEKYILKKYFGKHVSSEFSRLVFLPLRTRSGSPPNWKFQYTQIYILRHHLPQPPRCQLQFNRNGNTLLKKVNCISVSYKFNIIITLKNFHNIFIILIYVRKHHHLNNYCHS